MKKALCIMGSPRMGGNTDFAAARIAEKLAPHFDVDLVRLPRIELKRCIGCRACMRLGRCAIDDDDFPKLWQQALEADVVVQTYPVYWNGPPGIMKDFIDRTHTAYATTGHMRDTIGYTVGVATLCGFETADDVVESWFVNYGGAVAGRVHLLAREKDDLRNDPAELRKLDRLIEEMQGEA